MTGHFAQQQPRLAVPGGVFQSGFQVFPGFGPPALPEQDSAEVLPRPRFGGIASHGGAKLTFAVDGYNDDSWEIYAIPEVRKFCAAWSGPSVADRPGQFSVLMNASASVIELFISAMSVWIWVSMREASPRSEPMAAALRLCFR